MKPWESLGLVCSALQVAGLFLILWHEALPAFTPVLIGITGFAGVAKYFLIDPRMETRLRQLYLAGALCGVMVIALACFLAATAP